MKNISLHKSGFSKINPKLYVKNRFIANLGYTPNFNNPKTHNEKIAKRRFNYTREMTLLSDKIAVRKIFANKIGNKHIIPMLFEMDTLTEKVYNKLHIVL